jgi:uncharacterized protein DUF6916
MAELTEREFSKHLNSKFNLAVNDRNLQVELVEVKSYRAGEHDQQGMERFSAFFKGPGDPRLPQQVYRFSHDQMGEFDIFLVPISGDQNGYRYEAVFNYFKEGQ